MKAFYSILKHCTNTAAVDLELIWIHWAVEGEKNSKENMRRPPEPDDSHIAFGERSHYNAKAGEIQDTNGPCYCYLVQYTNCLTEWTAFSFPAAQGRRKNTKKAIAKN